MLVLSRRRNEQLLIGSDITITVVKIGKDTVKLGIEAPRGVPVHRMEIAEKIAKKKARVKRD